MALRIPDKVVVLKPGVKLLIRGGAVTDEKDALRYYIYNEVVPVSGCCRVELYGTNDFSVVKTDLTCEDDDTT